MKVRTVVLVLLAVTVIAPILLYTDTLVTFKPSSSEREFLEDVSTFQAVSGKSGRLNLLPQVIFSTLFCFCPV
ncbi:hypothetical protein SLEP1_g29181 [Rubroshorea leprosula]|uniref:Uncharacterized protein n=1 Tax=Rubroshorea leprosula TaxID=152421 RepID=A0AAV5K6Y9_9ROSI|nr:hypothetical protein SLEP1_g29181 [Rubroshorea leprosula]